jgi:hypothetical protein
MAWLRWSAEREANDARLFLVATANHFCGAKAGNACCKQGQTQRFRNSRRRTRMSPDREKEHGHSERDH